MSSPAELALQRAAKRSARFAEAHARGANVSDVPSPPRLGYITRNHTIKKESYRSCKYSVAS